MCRFIQKNYQSLKKKIELKNIGHLTMHRLNIDSGKKRLDFVVSDQNSKTCSGDFRDFTNKSLTGKGYEVGINYPYKGAELIKCYGAPWKIVMQYRYK